MKKLFIFKKILLFMVCIIGTFLTGCNSEPATDVTRVTYNQVMKGFNSIISMKKGADNPTYKDSYIGTSSDSSVIIHVLGHKEDVLKATMMVGLSNQDYDQRFRNVNFLKSFLKNVTLNEDSDRWIDASLYKLLTTKQTQVLEKETYSAKFSYVGAGLYSLVIEPKVLKAI